MDQVRCLDGERVAKPGARRAEKVPEVRATKDRLEEVRVTSYADFFAWPSVEVSESRSCHNRSCWRWDFPDCCALTAALPAGTIREQPGKETIPSGPKQS